MRRILAKTQIFIHDNYELLKLSLLVTIISLVSLGLFNAQAINDRESKERQEIVLKVVKSIESETDEQTDVINKQFQAVCALAIDLSGEDGLKRLDASTEQKCLTLTRGIQ